MIPVVLAFTSYGEYLQLDITREAHLVQTAFETGLTLNDAKRAISILTGERRDSPALQTGSVVAN